MIADRLLKASDRGVLITLALILLLTILVPALHLLTPADSLIHVPAY